MVWVRRSSYLAFLAIAGWMCVVPCLGQRLYSYVDENGVRNFTNIPPKGPVQELKVSGVDAPAARVPAPPPKASRQTRYDPIIEKYASEFELDPSLIRSMIATESNFQPTAVSHKGAQGLMQLMPATAARVGVRDAFDPEENIRGGVRHMKSLLDRFRNDLTLSLAAYNAGENLVQRIGRVPNITETRNYVRAITSRYGQSTHSPTPNPATAPVAPAALPTFRFVENGVLHLTNVPPIHRRSTSLLADEGRLR